jgi:hypothetical protein
MIPPEPQANRGSKSKAEFEAFDALALKVFNAPKSTATEEHGYFRQDNSASQTRKDQQRG